MKYLAILLSAIVMTLTLMPCCASAESESAISGSPHKESRKCGQESENCCTNCPPFYVCGTCIGSQFTGTPVLRLAPQVEHGLHNTLYVNSELPLISASIWQPPKVS